MSDVKYDAEVLANQAQNYLNNFKSRMGYIAEECLDELYTNVIPYLETDTWTNYRESLRLELEHEYKFSKFKEPWATNFRRAVFVENRKELAELIQEDILKRIKHLEDCHQEFEQFRYSPVGDRYQDKVKENELLREMLKMAREALGKSLGYMNSLAFYTGDMADAYLREKSKDIRDALTRMDEIAKVDK
jgi:hypothetical protein